MNVLLWCSLFYFDTFLRHEEASRNESLSISGKIGETARQLLQQLEEKLHQAQADLGEAYSTFILGLDENIHHTHAGRYKIIVTWCV